MPRHIILFPVLSLVLGLEPRSILFHCCMGTFDTAMGTRIIPTIDSISAHCNCWGSIMFHPLSSCEPLSRNVGATQSPSERYGEVETPCLHRESNPAQSATSHFTDNYGVEQSIAPGYDAVPACESFTTFQRVVIHLQGRGTAHPVTCNHVN